MTILDHVIHDLKAYFHAQQVQLAESDPKSKAQVAVPTVEVRLGPEIESKSSSGLLASEFPIVRKALLIRGGATSAWSTEMNIAKITSAILFNKGLIFHLRSEGDKNTPYHAAHINKARIFYQKALELIYTCSPSEHDDFLLKSILLNNLGQICSSACDRCGEQVYLTELEKLLRHRHESDKMDGTESELILTLVLLLGVHRPAPAA